MQQHDQDPNNVYILVRVFNVKSNSPGTAYFPNPWTLIQSGRLVLGELNRAEWRIPVTIV